MNMMPYHTLADHRAALISARDEISRLTAALAVAQDEIARLKAALAEKNRKI